MVGENILFKITIFCLKSLLENTEGVREQP